jgi:hypothetical protein
MDETPVFKESDSKNLEYVRSIVLTRLKRQSTWQFLDDNWELQPFVSFETNQSHSRFLVLAQEILWQFIIQGIITPGKDASNRTLPFFRITDYGTEVLKHEKFIPHDPTSYLQDLRAVAKTSLGKVAIAYIEEALRCFTSGCHMASVLLLGVASESVFLELCEVVGSSLKDTRDQNKFATLRQVKEKHRWIVKKYSDLPGPTRHKQLPESLDITLPALFDLIRRQRNELGHPQENPPSVDREQAFVYFRTFPSYVRDIEAFAEYLKTNGL